MLVVAIIIPPLMTSRISIQEREPTHPVKTWSQDRARSSDSAQRHPLITEIYYDAPVANEYIAIANLDTHEVNVSDCILSDGEGRIAFPNGSFVPGGGRVIIAQNASLYYRDALENADFAYRGGEATPMKLEGGNFQLNNDGDEVLLLNASGTVIDVYSYGLSTYSGPGWIGQPALVLAKGRIAHRATSKTGFIDTNTSADWDNITSFAIGQSRLAMRTFEFDGVGKGFLSPDTSMEAMSEAIDDAESFAYLNVYEFTSKQLGERLRTALARGVDVRVLMEGSPVGGIEVAELEALHGLRDAGASVRLLLDNSSLGVRARYRYDHAKYLVVDNETIIVSSENWGQSGFPTDGSTGNRGWSVRLDNAELAGYFAGTFLGDWNPERMDSVDLAEAAVKAVMSIPSADAVYLGSRFSQDPVIGHFRVTPVIGPDNTLESGAVIGLMRAARATIDIEQFYSCKSWGSFPNLYLEEAIAAARRGVNVRILLDASPYNVEENDPQDNDDTVAYLSAIANREHIPIEGKLGNASAHGFLKFHNKGVLVDGKTMLVSSINWNLNSVTMNREVGLILENDELVTFFEGAFEYDWKDDVTAPIADAGEDITVLQGEEVFFSAGGSRDDIGITRYLWDIGGDGRYEIFGEVVSWRFGELGKHVVVLKVEDAWGNSDQNSINVTVLRESATATAGSGGVPDLYLVIAILAVSIGLIYAISRRKR